MTTTGKEPGALLAWFIVFMVISTIVVALRFVAIRLRKRAIRAHDVLCVISHVLTLGYAVDLIIGTVHGKIGYHMTEVTLPELTIALKSFWASEFMWATGITAFRLSMVLLYIEVFATKQSFRYMSYGAAGLVIAFYIASLLTILLLCRPIEANWNPLLPGATCGNVGQAELAAAGFNLVLDIVIVLLPTPVVWNLKLSQSRKISLTAVFALGLAIAGINIARIVKVLECDVKDFTYCTYDSAILTVAEMAVGVIAASIPILGPIFKPSFYQKLGAVKPTFGITEPTRKTGGRTVEGASRTENITVQKSYDVTVSTNSFEMGRH